MKFRYNHELVLQLPGTSIQDYDALIELENRIIAGLDNLGHVSGHEMGSGEMNIFIETDHPKLAFEKIRLLFGTEAFMPELKAAYCDMDSENYVILHPPGLEHFSVI